MNTLGSSFFYEPLSDPSIEDYAAIGNCRTLALVSRFGSIDWWCLPHFSSPSLLAALLDRQRGGRFALTPRGVERTEQAYEPASNVLRTRFHCRDGIAELVDFMTMPEAGGAVGEDGIIHEIVRIVRCVEGSIELQGLFEPRPDYASRMPVIEAKGDGHWLCRGHVLDVQMETSLPFEVIDGTGLRACVRLHAGEQREVMLRAPAAGGRRGAKAGLRADVDDRLVATIGWWRGWCSRCTYEGDYRDEVMRSCLALKLLTHRPSGAVVAAGTTSIPEGDSGDRNWDYRYCWLRDTSLVLQAFMDLGYIAESDAFLRWLLHATRRTRPKLQVAYEVHGGTNLNERVLPQLRGYHGLGPVRVGNAASAQRQNDIYGEVIITACDYAEHGGTLEEDEKELIADFAHEVCRIWREPDQGLWEIRLPPRHNTHSKLMCWAALDRALQLHTRVGLPVNATELAEQRDAIRRDIESHGFDAELDSYVGYYGGKSVDASLLLIPRLGYLDPNDPRMQGTVRAVTERLAVNGLLYRYPTGSEYDGVAGHEHLFAICSFWCVDCLARQGRLDEARALFERLLSLRNATGLYAEEFDVHDGRLKGNFPQAFSHVGLITAALSLSERARSPRRS